MLRAADLVIGMAREHVREVAVLEPEAGAHTFTLKELVQAAEAKGGRHRAEPISEWLARLAAGRRRDDMVGVGYDAIYDVDDPIGRSRSDYEVTADELDDLLGRLVALAWPTPTVQQGQERSA
jgi:protein-tyrosine-phosphatase